MSAAGIRAGRAFVEITGVDRASQVIDAVEAKFRRFADGVTATGAKVAAMGLAMNAPLAGSLVQFARFDDAMRAVGAVATASAGQLQEMTAVARDLGRTTSFTAAQVAGLMAELAKGGFSPDQVNAMTASVLNLARATGTDATRSAEIVAETMNQFGLAAKDTGRVVDVLALAANATNASVDGLGESLQYSGTISKELSLSLEETVAMMGRLANAGIKGTEAGTALRRLAAISAKSGKELYNLFGIRNTDTEGNLKKLPQILDEIGNVTANLPTAQRIEMLEEAFGLLGLTSASVLGRAGKATQDLVKQLENAQDSAKNAAEAMDAGIGGAFRVLLSAAEGVWLAMGEAVDGAVQPIIRAFASALEGAARFIETNKEVVVVFGAIAAAVVAAGTALIGLGGAVMGLTMGVMGLSFSLAVFIALAKAAGVATGALLATSAAARVVTFSLTVCSIASKGVGAAWGSMVAALKSGQVALMALRAALLGASGAAVSMSAVSAVLAGATATMPLSAGLASAGYTLLGGVLKTLMAPTSLLTVMGGVMGSVWAAAGVAVKAAWAAVIIPLVPFVAIALKVVAVVGSIGAILAVAVARTGLFSAAWSRSMDVLAKFVGIVKSTFSGVMTALQGGQYTQAIKILWAGIKAAFWTGVSETIDTMSYLLVNAIPGVIEFGKSLLSVLWDIFKSIPKLLVSALTGGASLAGIIASALSGGIGDAMNGVAARAASSRQELSALIDKTNEAAESAKALAAIQSELDEMDASSGQEGNGPESKKPRIAPKDQARYDELSAELERRKAELAAAEQRAAQAAETEAAAGQQKSDKLAARKTADEKLAENEKALKERIDALRDEALVLRHGEASAERFKFAQQGVNSELLKAYDAAVAAKRAAEMDADVRDRVTALKEEATALRMGADAAEHYKLQLMGATAEQLKAIKVAQEALASAKQQADLRSAGEALVEAMKTPLERFHDELQKLNELQAQGLLDGETGRRAREKYQKDFAGEADTEAKRKELFRAEQRRIQQLIDAGKLTAEAASERLSLSAALLQEAMRRAKGAGEQLNKLTNVGTFSGFAAGRMSGIGNRSEKLQEATLAEAKEQNKKLERQIKALANLRQVYG